MIHSAPYIEVLLVNIQGLLAIYAFGSRICQPNRATSSSDLDIAVLVEGYAKPLELFYLADQLVNIQKDAYHVDLLDLRAASTVMQYQIITTGICWWAKDIRAMLFEVAILSEKTALDEARAGLLHDIQISGRVYG